MMKPKLFLSYARVDMAEADRLFGLLTDRGCAVWMDRNEILAGDDFVMGLQTHLDGSDALVFLLTRHSAASSWCLAEVQFALGRGLVVIVVEREAGCVLPEALDRLLRDIQRVPWSTVNASLAPQILRARTRARRRLLVRAGASLVVAGGLSLLGVQAASRINRIDASRRLAQFVAELRAAAVVLTGEEIRSRLRVVVDNPDLPDTLRRLADNPALAPSLRVNAWQALAALQDSRQAEWRTSIKEIQWKGGRVADVLWANTTYQRGRIIDLVAERVRMAGLIFGPGGVGEGGLTLSDVRIRNADIWFLRIDGTQLIDVVFENCKFRGAQLNLTEAAGAQFVSQRKSDVMLSTDVTIMEDCWIFRSEPPPEQGVMDLTSPEQEVIFDGVQFERVQFEGRFKPTWFRKCHFGSCVFPASLTAVDLEQGQNMLAGKWLSGS